MGASLADPTQPGSNDEAGWGFQLAALLAIALPTLVAYNLPPSATFFNQAASLVGWGLLLTVLLASTPATRPMSGVAHAWPLLAVLGVLGAAAAVSPLWTGLPWSLALSALGFIGAAAVAVAAGARLARAGSAPAVFHAVCIALVVAGVLGTAIGIVQVFAPQWADGDWIALSAEPGRAAGNLRQPNHLSSLLLWSLVATLWLLEAGRLRRAAAAALGALFVFGIVLSASRTGMVGIVLLALWGARGRRLSRPARVLLLAAPLAYAVGWLAVTAWAEVGRHVFVGDERFSQADVSSSRFGIWADTLVLIARHPWLGVGFGEFNFAWTLTPFPHRPIAFFDHTHNLPLQFIVVLGVPLGTLLTALLAWALWRAWRIGGALDGLPATTARAAWMMVLLIGLHSLLEYPLWYGYFLLPTAFVFGLGLGMAPPAAPSADAAATPRRTRPLLVAAMLLALGGAGAIRDYHRVVPIFAPPEEAPPLAERIAEGRRSWFFSHHAAYAAATTAPHPSAVMWAFGEAPHYLLDARLMMAWARAFEEAGDDARARFVAARLREFRNAKAEAFFAPCAALPGAPPAELPFQCRPPSRGFTYEDFRRARAPAPR